MKLKRPTLLLDLKKCRQNIQEMATKARQHNLIFRPHFKTHQSAAVGDLFREFGVNQITVSSVVMAEYFASSGWGDITIAFPVNVHEMDEMDKLAGKISLNLLVENIEGVQAIAAGIKHTVGIFVKIDAGYHRTGIPSDDHEQILTLIRLIQAKERLRFKGLIVHNGNTYHRKNREEILKLHNDSLSKMNQLNDFLAQNQILSMVSFGDTPALSITENFAGIDEIRPGNFVFFDLVQQQPGICTYSQIAVALACPVVAVHKSRHEVVIYGGAIHLSKDFLEDENKNKVFGKVVWLDESGWSEPVKDTWVKALSQEHGIIKTTPENIGKFYVGQFVGILPVHSCLTTNMMHSLQTLDGAEIKTMRGAGVN